MVPSSELLNRISSVFPSVHKVSDEVNDTARSYQVSGHRGTFGFISSMSDHFCSSCNRLRLTADGQIKVDGLRKMMVSRLMPQSRSAYSTVKRLRSVT